MYVRHFDGSHVVADVYPFAEPDSDPRFLAASPHYAVMPEGDILYNGKVVTVEGEINEAVRRILAIVEAERIAGGQIDRNTITVLAKLLGKEANQP